MRDGVLVDMRDDVMRSSLVNSGGVGMVCRFTNLCLQFDSSGIVIIFISRCHLGYIIQVLRMVSQTHDTWTSRVMNVRFSWCHPYLRLSFMPKRSLLEFRFSRSVVSSKLNLFNYNSILSYSEHINCLL